MEKYCCYLCKRDMFGESEYTALIQEEGDLINYFNREYVLFCPTCIGYIKSPPDERVLNSYKNSVEQCARMMLPYSEKEQMIRIACSFWIHAARLTWWQRIKFIFSPISIAHELEGKITSKAWRRLVQKNMRNLGWD